MKRKLIITGVVLFFSFLVSIPLNEGHFNYDFMTLFGLLNALLAALGIFIGLILLLARDRQHGLDLLAASGMVLLVGVGVCSAFPMHLRMM